MTDSDRDGDRDDEELAEVARDLSAELQQLRAQLEEQEPEGPPRGPLGLPRPPTPSEFAQFADEVAIPGLIAILEANIKLLEALQKAIRLANTERRARERSREVGSEAADRAEDVTRSAMERLQDGLDDLRGALERDPASESGDRPRVGDDILDDIETLQSEIDERLDESRQRRDRDRRDRTNGTGEAGSTADDVGNEDGDEEATTADRREDDRTARDRREGGVKVDVDAELESLREQYGEDDGDGTDEGDRTGDGADGDDGDGADDAGSSGQ